MYNILYVQINFVREDDDEYDVEYENGTVYTIKVNFKNTIKYNFLRFNIMIF